MARNLLPSEPLALRLTERLAHDAQRVRMLGASAIDLAWTAEGRLDACIMLGNKPAVTNARQLADLLSGADAAVVSPSG